MTPHDLSGRQIELGDFVICPLEQNKICVGFVSEVNAVTGAIVAQTVVTNRVQTVEEVRFLFPANQVFVVPLSRLLNSGNLECDIVVDRRNQWRHKIIEHRS